MAVCAWSLCPGGVYTLPGILYRLVAARASGYHQPDDMNEILRDIPPRRGVLPVPGPARGSPRVDETYGEAGEWEVQGIRNQSPSAVLEIQVGDAGSSDPGRWEGRLNHRLG